MGLSRNHLITTLIYIFVLNEIQLPLVMCQNEDSPQCMLRTTFLALLRAPEANTNLDAYPRIATVNKKNRNEMAHLKALAEEPDLTEICVSGHVYLQLLKGSSADFGSALNERTQRFSEVSKQLQDDSQQMELQSDAQKRSIATLAKNDDLPISILDRMSENENDEEKRAVISREPTGPIAEEDQGYLLTGNQEALSQDTMEKRNVGTLARDFALPPGRRNIASLVRDYESSQNKPNRNHMITFLESGKRNVASVARDYGLPYGKRYVGSLAKANDFVIRDQRNIASLAKIGDFPMRDQRSVASLAKNSLLPVSLKRGASTPGSVILRVLSRRPRSPLERLNTRNMLLKLQELVRLNHDQDYEDEDLRSNNIAMENELNEPIDRRAKRQIDFSDEYPLPVMQNTNVIDYEEMMETLNGQYPNAEKRFMGRIPQMGPRPTTPSTRRQGR